MLDHLNGNGGGPLVVNRIARLTAAVPEAADVPCNLDAERAVLGSMMLDNDQITALRGFLSPSDFWRDAHAVLYRAMLVLHAQEVIVDAVTTADELTRMGVFRKIGGDDLLADVCNSVAHGGGAPHYADLVVRESRKRALIEHHAQGLKAAYDPTVKLDVMIERSKDGLAQIDRGGRIDADEDDDFLSKLELWPKPIAEAGWYGLAGEFVRAIEPYTEADPAAVLVQLLTAIGNYCGRTPHWRVESSRHNLNLFACVVGRTSKARKGTSFNHVGKLLKILDDEYAYARVVQGIASGEGLITEVADDQVVGNAITPGVDDKRLLWVEEEFAALMTVVNREGNTLGSMMRLAWDGKPMSSRSKNRPVRSMAAHVSVIGHITFQELEGQLTSVQAANGFGNRFLWVCAERTKLLPEGTPTPDDLLGYYAGEFRRVREFAEYELSDAVAMERSRDARPLWRQIYHELAYCPPGMLGAITSRAEPQVMRIAALYALLDRDRYIRPPHLEAALAVWRYCFDSARYIFGKTMGDPKSEKLLKALAEAGGVGMARTEIRRHVFQGHISAAELDDLLARLLKGSLVVMVDPPASKPAKGKHAGMRFRLKDLNHNE